MNESIFACYDSLFCAGSLQELQNDSQGNIFDGQCEMPVQQQQLFQENSRPAAAPSPQKVVGHDDVGLMMASALSVSNSASYSTPHKTIPFVQIHTTDVHQQRSNYGNVFRRAVSNHAEIKSEPIKFEAVDSSKERVNATPTPPVRNVNCNHNERVATPSSPSNVLTKQSDAVAPQNPSEHNSVLGTAYEYNSVRKCKQCRFICLDDSIMEEHMVNVHSSSNFNGIVSKAGNKEMLCPGCSNVFFAYKSLEIHLIVDHFASEADAKKLTDSMRNTLQNRTKVSAQLDGTTVDKGDDLPFQERKSRIYLKNVECLREPRREPIETDGAHHSHIADGFLQANTFNNLERYLDLSPILNSDFVDVDAEINAEKKQDSDSVNTSCLDPSQASILDNRPKQKISIKSVDVLREPALLRRDFNMQNQFCNMGNNRNDLNFDTFNGFQPPLNVGSSKNGMLCSVSNTEEINDKDLSLENPRRPKIYIKNVDILKEPIMLPTFSSNALLGLQEANSNLNYNFLAQSIQQASSNPDFINNNSSLGATNQAYEADNIAQLTMGASNIPDSFMYENLTNGHNHINNNSDSDNSLLTDLNVIGGADSFQSFGNNKTTVDASFPTYPLVNCTGINSSEYLVSNTPIITEPTPPPAQVFAMQSTEDTLCNSVESIPAPTPPKQKQKIFIKNVDILKEPQFQEQRERGTLHLRTVDELNLMNRNEVESLIAPNLENNNVNSSSSSFTTHSEDHTQLPEEDDTAEQDMFYEENPLKLQDYASQLVNNWSADDYDLGEEIDCIITDSIDTINNIPATLASSLQSVGSTSNLQKMFHELEAPQISMISIRDIEELTGPQQQEQQSPHVINVNSLTASTPNHRIRGDSDALQNDGTGIRRSLNTSKIMEDYTQKPSISSTLSDNKLKTCDTKKVHIKSLSPTKSATNTATATASVSTTSFSSNLSANPPPLMPVTCFSLGNKVTPTETTTTTSTVVSLVSTNPPPLVPVLPLVSLPVSSSTTKSIQTTSTLTTSAANTITATSSVTHSELGRIYVANNLMQKPLPKCDAAVSLPQKSNGLSVTGGTSVRGRPFGSNRSDTLSKVRSELGEVVLKCSMRGCAFRFKKPDTLAYHKRCHDSDTSLLQAKICPECKSKDFGNWNTLHTHLWRSHQIDMELYSCSQCPFKTPIYSRLVNTHTKIHSEERNYKCEQCGKAFKNTKQLKNHRRWHRTHNNVGNSSKGTKKTEYSNDSDNINSDSTIASSLITTDLHRCTNCGAAFSHQKSLREHSCKNSNKQLLCSVCGHIASSKSSLKLHMFKHENSKRLKCSSCTYSTNDHNALRRHKMTHENKKMYVCPHCNYKSIQSVTFQKHVLLKHPDSASTIIHKCQLCSYSTVNRTLFALHQIRHKPDPKQSELYIELDDDKTVSEERPLFNPENICYKNNNKIKYNNNNNNKEDVAASTES